MSKTPTISEEQKIREIVEYRCKSLIDKGYDFEPLIQDLAGHMTPQPTNNTQYPAQGKPWPLDCDSCDDLAAKHSGLPEESLATQHYMYHIDNTQYLEDDELLVKIADIMANVYVKCRQNHSLSGVAATNARDVMQLIKARDEQRAANVTRFEVIDHRECFWCRGRKTANYLQKNGEYKEDWCDKCGGSGIMGGRVYSAHSNAETSVIKVELSYQDGGKTLKVFVNDLTQSPKKKGSDEQ